MILTTELLTLIPELAAVLIMAMYIVFAFVVTRQVRLMNDSLATPVKSVFTLMALLHFLAAVLIFGLALLAL